MAKPNGKRKRKPPAHDPFSKTKARKWFIEYGIAETARHKDIRGLETVTVACLLCKRGLVDGKAKRQISTHKTWSTASGVRANQVQSHLRRQHADWWASHQSSSPATKEERVMELTRDDQASPQKKVSCTRLACCPGAPGRQGLDTEVEVSGWSAALCSLISC